MVQSNTFLKSKKGVRSLNVVYIYEYILYINISLNKCSLYEWNTLVLPLHKGYAFPMLWNGIVITNAVEWDGLEDFVDNPIICMIIDAV